MTEEAGAELRLSIVGRDTVSIELPPYRDALRRKAPREELGRLLRDESLPLDAALCVACLLVFCETRVWVVSEGLRIRVEQDVPQGDCGADEAMGIAVLLGLEKLAGRQFLTTEAARIVHQAETDLLGRDAVLADKMATAYGSAGKLLPVLCQPERLYPCLPLPAGSHLIWRPGPGPSPTRREAALNRRTAAFMGWKLIERHLARAWHHAVDIPLDLFRECGGEALPESIDGERYLALDAPPPPGPMKIRPSGNYAVRAALRSVLEEHRRTGDVLHMLAESENGGGEDVLSRLGEAMDASREEYARHGLIDADVERGAAALHASADGTVRGLRLCGDGISGTIVALVEQ